MSQKCLETIDFIYKGNNRMFLHVYKITYTIFTVRKNKILTLQQLHVLYIILNIGRIQTTKIINLGEVDNLQNRLNIL